MPVLLSFAKRITQINRYLAYVASTAVLLMVLMIIYDVVCRYFFNHPTVWAMELSTMLFGPYFLLSGAYILNQRGHVSVDILYTKLSASWKKQTDRLFFITVIVLCALFIWMSVPIAVDAFHQSETSFSSWNPPVWPLAWVIPFALLQLLLQAIAELIVLEQEPNA